jgi:hypothetical protein
MLECKDVRRNGEGDKGREGWGKEEKKHPVIVLFHMNPFCLFYLSAIADFTCWDSVYYGLPNS